jgi:hypothetical protein
MYHKGYGPTNVTLGNYLKNVFLNQTSEAHDTKRNFHHRADTILANAAKRIPRRGRAWANRILFLRSV